MLSQFFISRPIFAWVLAIAVMIGGLGALFTLPVAQYPDIAPPTIGISATYPGASADTVESSITQVLEQQLTGLDGMLYFSASSSSAGQVNIQVTFEKGTNPDTAQVQVQNKVQQAVSRLPQAVQQQGVTVQKRQNDFLAIVTIYDETDTSSSLDIGDYLVTNFQDTLSRIDGIGAAQVFGAQYAMRIWLDPYKLSAVQLMPSDVIQAIQTQNTEVSAGQIGALPAPAGQQLNATVTAKSRFRTADQFKKIVVKTKPDGSVVFLGDIARVELGGDSYDRSSRLDRHPAAGLALQLAPGADALKTADLVKAKVEELSAHMPNGYKIAYPRDSTDFVKLSIEEVAKTLAIAIVLVVLVMFAFLRSWRATLVPAIAVPVVMLGTFGVLSVLGYSINTLTLFGMVLSIGLLVDDAIVVVENVERLMHEEGLSPKEATRKSMGQISGALIGIGLVLTAVLLPMAFFGGSTGVIYRQFSVTVVTSAVMSVMVALILSPALCATLLKPPGEEHLSSTGPLARFNQWFNGLTKYYVGGVKGVVVRRVIFFGFYAIVVVILGVLFVRLPTSFLPVDDQGQLQAQFTLPAGAVAERTTAALKEVEDYYLGPEKKNVNHLFLVQGFNNAGTGQNSGQGFAQLAPFDKRPGEENSAGAIARRATRALGKSRDATILALTPPAIRGLGQSNGFTFELLNTGGLPRDKFNAIYEQLMAAAQKDPKLTAIRASELPDTPQLKIDLDEEKLAVLGLSEQSVLSTLTAAWGGSYVNDFVDRGRVKRVYVQGDAPFRSQPSDLDAWYVRSSTGAMTPFSAIAKFSWTKGPVALSRFNGVPSHEIQGQSAPGSSSGDAMLEMEKLHSQLDPGTSFAWSSLSYEEKLSGGRAPLLYGVSLLAVFLCLAALYESWSIPFAVLLVVPMGVIGAVLAATLRTLDNNIYLQVGLLTTAGLTAKNAILIVEFAEAARRKGVKALDAALEAAKIRFRPIIMTSIAFMAGVLPMALADGAGAASRIALGTAVIGGMLSAMLLAIFFVPLFFVLVSALFDPEKKKEEAMPPHPAPAE
ncbi:MAG TPA: efflux RND transporter permease subunit [Hyphomonadaceae bacterium]|nr:efflux RND transporter permease subunit [Hyphomonadaceae bacterium]